MSKEKQKIEGKKRKAKRSWPSKLYFWPSRHTHKGQSRGEKQAFDSRIGSTTLL